MPAVEAPRPGVSDLVGTALAVPIQSEAAPAAVASTMGALTADDYRPDQVLGGALRTSAQARATSTSEVLLPGIVAKPCRAR